MYNLQRAPKNENNFANKCLSFSLPQHILKLVKALLRLKFSSSKEEESRLDILLKSNLSILKQDQVLNDLYSSLGWSEDSKTFNKTLTRENILGNLQKVYDFNLKDLESELVSANRLALLNADIESFHQKSNLNSSNSNQANNYNKISNYQTTYIHQENSLSSVIKTELNEDPFKVEKPVPVNQTERHGPEHYESLFLTNSGKVWTQEDESKIWNREYNSNLNSRLLSGSNQNTLLNNKTPSFHQEDDDSRKQTSFSFKDINFNKKTPFPYRDFKEGFMNEFNNENRLSSSFSLTSKNGNSSQEPYVSFKSNKASIFNYNPTLHNTNSQGQILKSALIPTSSKYIQNFNSDNNLKSSFGYELEKTNNIKTTTYQDANTQKKRGRKKKQEKTKFENKNNIETSKVTQKKLKKTSLKNRVRKMSKIRESSKKKEINKPFFSQRLTYFGLKEISKKVKEIVKRYKKASYKQISDIIVNEINEKDTKDEKNIRRRIYDSLNVMKAMNLFKKDTYNKCILWNGTNEVDESENDSFSEESDSFNEEKPNLKIKHNMNNFSFKKRKRSDSQEEFHISDKTSKLLKCENNLQEQELMQEKINIIVIFIKYLEIQKTRIRDKNYHWESFERTIRHFKGSYTKE
jgi:hypothetical protein